MGKKGKVWCSMGGGGGHSRKCLQGRIKERVAYVL